LKRYLHLQMPEQKQSFLLELFLGLFSFQGHQLEQRAQKRKKPRRKRKRKRKKKMMRKRKRKGKGKRKRKRKG